MCVRVRVRVRLRVRVLVLVRVRVRVCDPLIAKSFMSNKVQGDHPFAVCDGPTKRPQQMRISGLITLAYLPSGFANAFATEVARGQAEKPHKNVTDS